MSPHRHERLVFALPAWPVVNVDASAYDQEIIGGERQMKCKHCGADNSEKNLYCSSCGGRLQTKIVCRRCARELPQDSKFCTYCGGKAKMHEGRAASRPDPKKQFSRTKKGPLPSKKRGKARGMTWTQLVAVIAVTVVATGAVATIVMSSSRPSGNLNTGSGANIVWSAEVNQIASKFNCPCEKCGVVRLDLCSCDIYRGSVEVKNYIQDLINEDLSVEDIAQKVEARYGNRI